MNKLRRLFTISVMVMTIVVMSGAVVTPTKAAAQAGDLIKMDGITAVYYLGDDGKRYVFPNEATYMSWYNDFSGVVTVSASELQSYMIGGNVVVRPGTKLVKITTDPTVYAVGPDGVLHSIVSEANAIDLYGANWATMVIDVPDSFFTNYTVGAALTAGMYPAGQLLKMEGSADVYYYDGSDYRMFGSEAAFLANGFSWDDVVTTDMSFTAGGSTVSGFEADLFNPSQNGSTGPISIGSGLSVALSAATPAATTVPSGATGVVATKFNVTASNDGEVVLQSVVVERSGIGDESKIDKVYLYDGNTRLTTGRSISDSTQTAAFSNLNYTVPAGMTKTLSIVMDVATSASGEHALGISAASAIAAGGATVTGSFPVKGNTMSLSSTAIGAVDVEENDSGTTTDTTYDYTVYSGDSNVELGKFTVYVTNIEDAQVESITLYNGSRDVVENLELYRGSELVASGEANGDYTTFELSTPYQIEKGGNAQFTLMGDITDARDGDSTAFYIRYKTDVRVKGNTYGYYLTVVDDGDTSSMVSPLDTSVQVAKATVEAGQVTFTSDGTPLTNNVAKDSNDVPLLNFNIATQAGVDVEQVGITIIDSDNSDNSDIDNDISNLELLCDGVIVAEWADPAEASAGTTETETSVWTIGANETVNCQVRVDIESTKGSEDISANVDVSAWIFKDSTTGDTITDVIPSADIIGNTMSVVAASLTATEASVPTSQTWVAGESFDSNGFNFAAGDAQAVTVTSLSVTGYYLASGGTTPIAVSSAMRDVVSSVELYADGVKIGETKTLNTSGVAIFNTLNWDIAAGATEKLVVVANTAKGSVNTSDDTIKFAVTAASAEYTSDGTSLSADIIAIDTAAEIDEFQTITDGGSLTAVIDADTPDSALLVMGSSDVVMTTVKFSATNESFVVEKLQVKNAAGTTDDDEYTSVSISYTNSAGNTETKTGSFAGTTANFSGLDIFVEKDEDALVNLMATLNTSAAGADNDSTTALDLDEDTEFRAVAQNSGTVVTDLNLGADVQGQDMYIYKSIPTVAFAATTPSGDLVPNANSLLAKISITADAGDDITFDKATNANSLTVQVATSGAIMGTLTLKDGDGNLLDTATNTAGEYTFDFTDSDFTVPAGATKYFQIYGSTTGFSTAGDTVQIWLDDTNGDIDWGVDGTGSYNRGNILFKGDLFGGALVKP